MEDEEISEAEEGAVEEAREWLKHNSGIPLEQLAAEWGFTIDDITNNRDDSKVGLG